MNKANRIYIDKCNAQARKDFFMYGYDDSIKDLNKRLRELRIRNLVYDVTNKHFGAIRLNKMVNDF